MITQPNYYRIMPGQGSKHAPECYQGGFIGADYGIDVDLTGKLPDDWHEFNERFIPVYLQKRPHKSKIAAGLACGAVYTVAKGIQKGDLILSPDGNNQYLVGEVISDYSYHPDQILPHRRTVDWRNYTIARGDMSEALQNSTGSAGTVCNITKYAEEIEQLLAGHKPPALIVEDETIEDPTAFVLEKHLEYFLVNNWQNTVLGKTYDIFDNEEEFSEQNKPAGQQFNTDTGPIDILAVSKDQKELLVIELKRGRASDVVVGQIQRYMGYVQEELTEPGQTVRGVIIALEDDLRIRRALAVAPNIDFYRYQVDFNLFKEYPPPQAHE